MVSDGDYQRAHEVLNRPLEGSELPEDFDPGPRVEEENLPAPQSTGRSPIRSVLPACFFIALGAFLHHHYQKPKLPTLTDEITVEEDLDGDGRPDRVLIWLNNKPTKGSMDRDGNGTFETTVEFDDRGGAMETIDFDLDSEIDLIAFYEGIRYVREDWLKDGRVFKRVRFDGIRTTSEALDLDGDGNFEVQRTYDAYGEREPTP
jgi:hypothetical protein